MSIVYVDNIIIGAGFSGLTLGALLAKQKKEVLLLEAHSISGGCASYFQRQKFVFDAGATTLSGINGLDSLKKIIEILDLKLNLVHCDPGVVIHLGEHILHRYTNVDRWIDEQKKIFSTIDVDTFWQTIEAKSKKIYRLIDYSQYIPIDHVNHLLGLLKGHNILKLQLLKDVFFSFEQVHSEIKKDRLFLQMINEMLLIAAQNYANHVPAMIGYLALNYLEDSWYCYGGMKELNFQFQSSLKSNQGDIYFNNEVQEIKKRFNFFEIKTTKKTFRTKRVFSSIPIWNTLKLSSNMKLHQLSQYCNEISPKWGAVTGYFVLKSDSEIKNLYHQVHCEKPIRLASSPSVFISFSPLDDEKRNDGKFQTVTMSIHIDLALYRNALKESPREELKNMWEENFRDVLMRHFHKVSEIKCLGIGDPLTFERYTRRHQGSVGGIPHDVGRFILNYPQSHTGEENFYQLGDTTFPGQGIVGVMQGALNLSNRLMTN